MGKRARRVRSAAAGLSAGVALALIVAWAVGRVVTDGWVWSQWVFWTPPVWVAAAAGVFLAVSRGLRAGERAKGRVLRRAGVGGLVVLLLVTVMVDWRMWMWPGRWWAGAPTGPVVRVVGWNTAMKECPGAAGMLAALAPDLVVMSNPPAEISWDGVKAAMGEGAAVVRPGLFTVASRWSVLRYGSVNLGLGGRIFQFDASDLTPGLTEHIDNGCAAFVELDTTEVFGRPIVVWAVDLPSDPFLGRVDMLRRARAAVDAWAGPERRPGVRGQAMVEVPGFPAPDLIVGDFNTPRGSGSLRGLTGGLRSAYSEAGIGVDGTWPRQWPLFDIDQMFLAPWLRARGYEVIDPSEGTHRLQVAEIERAPGG